MLVSAVLWVQLGSSVPCAQTTTPPPARPATPPTPPAAPAPAQTAIDVAAREALQQYSTALETLDADQVRKIHPAVDAEGLKRAFREMRELKVTIDNVKVLSTEGAIARVSCRVTQTLTPKAGAKQTSAVTRVLRLRRQEAVWVIDGFER
ncbi:MAG TPA: hypothetical protein VH740_22995 [Vicinamibacterales bacterium]|jgi:hypothetical protein